MHFYQGKKVLRNFGLRLKEKGLFLIRRKNVYKVKL